MTLALLALAVVLLFAIVRPHGWPEAVVAIPAAALLIASGVIPMDEAAAEVNRLLPVVGFLAAILVLARLCDDEGLFHAAGVAMARISAGRPKRLLAMVFVVASATTAILSLDATVVLLTPVVLATARSLAVPARPHAYATAHLANTASLLLPVSNLTNLLAFTAAGLSFLHFAAVMTLPWLAAIAVEFLLLRWLFARDLSAQPQRKEVSEAAQMPVFVLVVLALTLVGFALTSLFGHSPAWAALAGAIVLGVRALVRRDTTISRIVAAADVPFLAFVLCLGVVVDAVMLHGLDSAMRDVLPTGATLPALLGYRGGRRGAVQHRQQSARRPGDAAPGRGVGSGSRARRPGRRERRAEPDLCGLARQPVVAQCRSPRNAGRFRRIHPHRPVHRAADAVWRRCSDCGWESGW